jgi:hypothetical protein
MRPAELSGLLNAHPIAKNEVKVADPDKGRILFNVQLSQEVLPCANRQNFSELPTLCCF